MDKKVTTTNITYNYDETTGKMIGKTIVESTASEPATITTTSFAYDNDAEELTSGIEITDGMSSAMMTAVMVITAIGLGFNIANAIFHRQ